VAAWWLVAIKQRAAWRRLAWWYHGNHGGVTGGEWRAAIIGGRHQPDMASAHGAYMAARQQLSCMWHHKGSECASA